MGVLDTLKRLGKKVVNTIGDAVDKGARFGEKVLGGAGRIGSKVASVGSKVLGVLSAIPGLPGQSYIGMGAKALDKLSKASEMSQNVAGKLERGRNLVRTGQEAVMRGDMATAQEVLRKGRKGMSETMGDVRRARDTISNARRR